jgi:hypothetical protein
MSDFIFLSLLELFVIVFFAVHLEHNEDIFGSYQEAFSVVLGHSTFDIIVNDNFLIVSLVIFSVRC